jgi:hypothetical protein
MDRLKVGRLPSIMASAMESIGAVTGLAAATVDIGTLDEGGAGQERERKREHIMCMERDGRWEKRRANLRWDNDGLYSRRLVWPCVGRQGTT